MSESSQATTAGRDSVLARFMVGFDGHSLPDELAEYLARGLAGVVIYQRNFSGVEELSKLTTAIRRAAGRPVLIGIDQEGGTRFALREPFTQWPSAAALGRLGDVAATENVARAMALEIRAGGCNVNFAPMVDLHVNPESPVTKDRSFGDNPQFVAQMGAAFVRGSHAGGVLSCAKHFPGHGDASVDPHLDLPVFQGTMTRLESTEIAPFAAAVAAGVALVMTAHILLPRIEPEVPASLSRSILDGLLRRKMNFGGLILADDLGMGAIAKRYGAGDAAVRTLQAGTDVAMLCHDWSAVAPAIAAVRRAREDGHFNDEDWGKSVERIDRICAQSELARTAPALSIIGCQEHTLLAGQIRGRVS